METFNPISQIEDSFDNPFEDNNANTISSHRLLELWCDPFAVNGIKGMSLSDFASSSKPIILQGARGSGKTTILKYFSYPLLRERARANGTSIFTEIKKQSSVGFYFRCDDSFINSFQSIFKYQNDNWLQYYDHYIELLLCMHILDLLNDLLIDEKNSGKFIELFKRNVNIKIFDEIKDLKDLENILLAEIRYFDDYRNEMIFGDAKFSPNRVLSLYVVSEKIIESLIVVFPELKSIKFLILLDEYENLTPELQMYFNSKVKFAKERITFRIGRRSEGVVTTATINRQEYLRSGHDYDLAQITLANEQRKDYFLNIANKRLENSKYYTNTGIIGILGNEEDLDLECKEICDDSDKHLHAILSTNSFLKEKEHYRNKIISIIRNKENPIAETLNALWVIRYRSGTLLDGANRARSAMLDFFAKNETRDAKKYKNDYVNKYRYAITVLLASIYKKKKLYYGFNAIALMSDGNARTFINFCRYIINDAFFFERNTLLKKKIVSKESQNRAIREFSAAEFRSICSIVDNGKKIETLVKNIANVLIKFHTDKKVRYPETTQFSFNISDLQEMDADVLNTAINWSIICKKINLQRISAGIDQKGELYYINKAFAPIFGISYRFRGGVNIVFTRNEITEMMIGPINCNKLKSDEDSNSEQDAQLYLF